MTIHNSLLTIRDFIRYATSRFNETGLYFGHGTDNAWDEALALILPSLHLPHDINPSVLDANLTEPERKKLFDLIELRVSKRIPVPYLTHQAWFAGSTYYVDERVLIPRSPIGELIESQFNPWVQPAYVHRILDLCTGSGCIAIACAQYFPQAEVDATDISADALAVAKINVLRHNMEDQVHLHMADLFNGLAKQKYDIIVSNPPYVSREEVETLPPEYLHEPMQGLRAGEQGLDFVLRILDQATDYLSPNGIIVIEVGNSEEALIELLPNIPFTWLEFERSDGGVFLLTADELEKYNESIKNI